MKDVLQLVLKIDSKTLRQGLTWDDIHNLHIEKAIHSLAGVEVILEPDCRQSSNFANFSLDILIKYFLISKYTKNKIYNTDGSFFRNLSV